jgi:hypothetical protein
MCLWTNQSFSSLFCQWTNLGIFNGLKSLIVTCLSVVHSTSLTPCLHEQPKSVHLSIWFCQAFRLIFEIGIFLSLCPILCNSRLIMSQRFQMKLSINLWTKKLRNFFLVHRFIQSFVWKLWLTIRHELHKIRWRDRKIPISKLVREPGKIAQTAWQNQSDVTKIGSTTVCVNRGGGKCANTLFQVQSN